MKKCIAVLAICLISVAVVIVLYRNNEDIMPKDSGGNHYQSADELTPEAEADVTIPSDSASEDSNIGVQIIHDEWGYTLKDFYFSDTLPEGFTKNECRDFTLPKPQPDENGVDRWVKAGDHIADDGSYDGAFGLDCVWLIVEMDIQNLTGKAQMQKWGSHDLHMVGENDAYPYGGFEGAHWFSLHDNCGVRPDGFDGVIDYFCAYFEAGETKTARFGWLVERKFAEEGVTRWVDLDVWGYSLEAQDKVGHLYLR